MMVNRISERPQDIAKRLAAYLDSADPVSKQLSTSVISLSARMELKHGNTYKDLDVNRGLTTAITCLRLAGEPYELRHKELTQRILLTSGGVTNLCHKLINMQIIEKEDDEEDGRGIVYRLTDKGISLSDQLIERVHSTEREIFSTLNSTERSDLAVLLKKVLVNLD